MFHTTRLGDSVHTKLPRRSRGFMLVQSALIGMAINAAQAQEAQTTSPLPTVTVQVEKAQESATGPVSGYLAKRSATATKTDTPLLETSQSISVVTRDQMTNQAVQTAEQALRYTSGVLTEITGYDLRYQALNVRGFDPSMYLDGMRTFGSGTYADWHTDPQGLERVEVLKGPASVLYGQGSPGGLVNQVSKRPSANTINEVGISVGNHDRYEATIDVGGPLNHDGSLLFRLNGKARKANTQTDYVKDDRLYLAPSLTWRPSASTSLTILADITQDRMTAKSWWPWYALITDQEKIPVNLFAGEPGFDHYNRDMASIAYLLEHKVNDDWTVRQNLRYSRTKLDYQQVYSYDWDASDPTHHLIERGSLTSRSRGNALTLDNQAETRFKLAGLDHKILAGLDFQRFSDTEVTDEAGGTAPSLDLGNPLYGTSSSVPGAMVTYGNELHQVGLYAQDQVRAGAWIFNLGLRHDRANTKFKQPDYAPPVLEADDSKTTYNLGALHTFANGLAPYASYSTSFQPLVQGRAYDGITQSGHPLKPETGKQFELGVKFQPKGSDSLFTASIFDLRKQNVATPDEVHTNFSVQTGEVRVRGLELEGNASLNSQLSLIASYTHLDPEVTHDNNPDWLGKQPVQTVRNAAKIWLDYKFSDGWRVGGGVRYLDKVPADKANEYYNPSYALFDAAIHYKTGPITLALNGINLFDKFYTANRAQFYGQARTLQASLTYRW